MTRAPYDAWVDAGAVVSPPHVARPLTLHPFRALRLSPSRIGGPSAARAFARPYKDVAGRLTRWCEQGAITADQEPAVYLHEYTAGGLTVRGLVGALDVSRRASSPEQRAVLPHEGIHPRQADELADRMAEMALNPAPILLVHRAPATAQAIVRTVLARPPQHAFSDRAGQRHRLWALRDPAELTTLEAALAASRALIADGHHRYAAYLRLQQRMPGGAADRGLAMLVDHDDTALFLGAIHRVLVGSSLADVASAARAAGARFAAASAERAVAGLGQHRLTVTDGQGWALVSLDVPTDRAAVEVVHDVLIPALPHGPRLIGYHHTVEDALAGAGPEAVAVLLPAPDVDLVLRIATADRLLPEKATSFQPKPSLGVLIRPLRGE